MALLSTTCIVQTTDSHAGILHDVPSNNTYFFHYGCGGAGSCPSSTVTMQMGIERVLRENFPNLGEVLQVEDPETAENEPKELEWRAVEAELARISPAITAMGGVVSIVSVDPIGVVELKYQGANKLKQGIELAVMDVAFVNHVAFVM